MIGTLHRAPNQPSIIMQDNAPFMQIKVTHYLQEEEIRVMNWSAQTPDLNSIENV